MKEELSVKWKRHLGSCSDCRAEFDSLTMTLKLYKHERATEPTVMPVGCHDRLVKVLDWRKLRSKGARAQDGLKIAEGRAGPRRSTRRLRISAASISTPAEPAGRSPPHVPAIRSIRERYADAHLVLVVGSQNAAAVLGQRGLDEIRVVDTRNFLGVARAGILDRGGRAPTSRSNFTTVSYSRSAAMLVRWAGAPERVGSIRRCTGERDRAGLTRRVPHPEARCEAAPPVRP